jgi:membrane protease YdiL (CAAX protease family)
LSLREDLGWRWPRPATLAIWLAAWAVWVAVGEYAIDLLGLDQAKPWPDYPLLIVALRVLAIGLLGPLAEELVMRGVLLHRLRATRLGVVGAIVLTAAGWAAMHIQYGAGSIGLIFLDGLILGTARVQSRSLLVPIAMHVAGNLFSIAQSLGLIG